MVRRIALLVALMLVWGGRGTVAGAQVGTSTEIITGRVVGPDSAAIAGATVEVTSVATSAVRRTTTRADGRFQLLFRDGGGQYRLRVTFLGMAPATTTLTRQADEDRLVVNVKMSRVPTQLAAVQVRARGNTPQLPQGAGAGGTQAALPPELLQRMPVNPGDLMASASLAPGVVGVSGTDSTGASFVVAAQPASQNNITVDGVSFLFGGVPQDAVRGTRVITNAYDVSRGQFTGGQVATTTKSGTGQFQGSANFTGRSPSFQSGGNPARTFPQTYEQQLVSGGAGGMFPGPLTDRGYYYVSGQFEHRRDAVPSLGEMDPGVLAKMGTSEETVNRFFTGLDRWNLRTRGTSGSSAPDARESQNASALARLDFDIGAAHQLMLRGDWRRTHQEGTRVSPLALPNIGGTNEGTGGGVMGTVTSIVGSFIHEAKLYWSQDRQDAAPYLRGPLGVVTATSTLEDGGQGIANLLFGGNPSLPRTQKQSLIEATDELSWLSKGAAHRVKLGLLANRDRATVGAIPNRFGTYLYPTLADFDANRPSLFSRTIGGTDLLSGTDNAALYLGDAWRVSPSLQLTYGVRAEGTRLPGAPARNPAVEQAFGGRTDEFPTDVAITPRLGFTYLVGNLTGIPKGTLRGGIGAFRGKVPGQLVGSVRQATGLPGSQVQLVCVGAQVPTPDFNAYFTDESTIPTRCADAGPQLPASAAPLPGVALFDADFGAPVVWRASLGGSLIKGARWVFGSDLLFAYGMNATRGEDLNLRPDASFRLASEGNRPVYVAPGAITPSGSASLQASRANGAFGSVTEIGSGLRSRTTQLTFSAQGPSLRSGFFSASYTLQRAEDQGNGYSFGAYLPTTAGDPRRAEWATSDLERRHIVTAMTLIPLPRDFEFTLIARAASGARFTPMVSGDVNGDGSRNDRAFVFDPASAPDTALANGMSRLLADGDSRAVRCLRSQLGKVASRNSCATPWTPSVDLQLNYRPTVAKLERRLTISLVAVNTLAGVDQLLHGDDLHGWGQPTFPDRTLLNIRGWDAASNRYLYQVNERFGSRGGAQNPFRIPFQLGLQMNLRVGVDAQKAAMQSIYGTADGRPPSKDALKARIKQNFPNPILKTLDVADSVKLDLTAEQKAKLQGMSKAFEQRADSILNIFAEVLVAAGPNPDPAQLGPKLMKPQMEAIRMIGQAITDLKATLSEEQFKKIPERIRLPFQAPPQQQQQRP